MCGIIGSFTNENNETQEKKIQEAINLLNHRGPDSKGIKKFSINHSKLILGHTRLAIIDLSPSGCQPMETHDKRYSIVFNGEIYNYKEIRTKLISLGHSFVSDSDTEVLLYAWSEWGEECLCQLKGMYSFVIFDSVKNLLTGVRDAFGIKPLFFHHSNKNFFFSSEVKPLLGIANDLKRPNWQSVYDYLVNGHYDNSKYTFFDGVYSLLPGNLFTVNLEEPNKVTFKRWWWPSIEENRELSFSQASEKLREMFLSNIKLHLRSDVQVGAALSGGIDSSAVVCAMRFLEPNLPIHTFSYIAKGSDKNEEKWVDLVNNEVQAIPHKVHISPNNLSEDINDLIDYQGEPFGSTSIYAQYCVFRVAKENDVTVILDGQGADELLAGYNGYPDSRLTSIFNKDNKIDFLKFLFNYSNYHNSNVSNILGPYFSKNINLNTKNSIKKYLNIDPPNWINKSWCHENNINMSSSFNWKELINDNPSRVLMNTLRHALSGKNGLSHLLRHEDRNSMRWSVESRVPFLTQDMAEFVLTLPESYLISNSGRTKHIFRESMRDIVPDNILDRKDKIGFETPEKIWMQNLTTKNEKNLFDINIPMINKDKMRKRFNRNLNNSNSFSWENWRIINFNKWHKKNFL